MAAVEIWRNGKSSHVFHAPGYFWILAGLFTAWCFIAILWSASPQPALGKVLFLACTILAAWVICCWLSTISSSMSRHLNRGLMIGIATGAIILTIEITFNQPLAKTFLNVFEFARPDSTKHIKIINNEVISLPLDLLNRNIATLNILLWPTFFLVAARYKGKMRWIIGSALIAIVTLATFYSEHETSKIALILGSIIFCLAYFLPRISSTILTLLWTLSILLVMPTAITAYNNKLHEAEWMPGSAQARIVLWFHTAQNYLDNPLLGIGVYSTQINDDLRVKKENIRRTHHYERIGTGRHSHNIFLQTWYELGLVGAMLLLATGLALLSRINALSDSVKPYTIAAYCVAIITASLTWGLWQVWYIAMFAFGAAAMLIAVHQNAEPDVQ